MRYLVIWNPSAEADLASIWTEHKDRASVTMAADLLEEQLRADPHDVGESCDGTTRFAVAGPLRVYFDVMEDDKQVIVWSVFVSSKK